ncbi:helix-turn-helix domain-containing protein [Marinimicrobium sp. C6131]|uniref:IclR family transcriptional regulator n=1 Tax=Marinimicrobium sp. C6131 TaxID=3022676 RepID=UPI00223D53F5|nr:helix-turn-helix domain-containing protein [Marinimicrobium sp. C6131]UZJ43863.1 helix-turn-helix domain-containing protein [Marinimicrobium sp. C6131]
MNDDYRKNNTNTEAEAERKYKAPALEKGLDVLELLASSREPLTTSQIAVRLGRSVSELFRMVLALEYRGYIVPAEGRDGYTLSNKLFALGIARAPTKTLIELALPVMSVLAREINQSCHIAMASGDQIVVIGRIENPGDLGFSVRVGYRRPLIKAASGLVLYGFQTEDTQAVMRGQLAAGEESLADFAARAEAARAQGYVRTPSDFIDGVTDLSAPLVGTRGAVAALTIPFVRYKPERCTVDEAVVKLCAAAADLSGTLRQHSL